MIGRGVAYRKTDKTNLLQLKRGSCSSRGVWRTAKRTKRTSYGQTGVLFIGRGVAYRKTGLHGILFISTVDLLQPPRAPVHPASTAALLRRLLFNHPSTIYCSSSPPHHGILFNHPSTGTPPPSIVHPSHHTMRSWSSTPPWAPLHRLLFIQPSTTPRGPIHPEATPPLTVHPTPPATLTVHPIDRLQLAATAKESLDRVQLTAID